MGRHAPKAIDHLHNRISMLQVVSELNVPLHAHHTFGIPSMSQGIQVIDDGDGGSVSVPSRRSHAGILSLLP
ncbi:hypothetical protein OsJ_20725 [Oryza sativa Japonica Group]|uniref:Uncharacterized protein n=1 Tax=Oryza sativa subsp. japonica TaxID=39947 RepID=B9FSD6_ORYSJ|nr:hypothetical protein OsJ_20725 [Oryza sativa Japonica Group]